MMDAIAIAKMKLIHVEMQDYNLVWGNSVMMEIQGRVMAVIISAENNAAGTV